MTRHFTVAELEAFLDEALTPGEMAEIEAQLRDRPEVLQQLRSILGRRDAGVHSLGAIWRRHRISCPSRDLLGSYLLGVLDAEQQDYIRFHLEQVGCRYCSANLEDLRARQRETAEASHIRRRRYFQSSAGYLK
jgi:hypothetical protein